MGPTPPLWQQMQRASDEELWLNHARSKRRYAAMMRAIAQRMDEEIIRDAGPPIGRYYLDVPSEWLRNHAKRAEADDES